MLITKNDIILAHAEYIKEFSFELMRHIEAGEEIKVTIDFLDGLLERGSITEAEAYDRLVNRIQEVLK